MLRFDIETDGLFYNVTKIHCLVISDGMIYKRYRPAEVEVGIKCLHDAINRGIPIAGHNIINYDIPVIQKVYPWFTIPRDKRHLVIDTLVLSRLIYANIKDMDAGLMRSGKLPGRLFGSHGLEAWGYRLGVFKGNYGKQEDAWAIFTEEMMNYNEQDVVVTDALLEKLLAKNYPEMAVTLEHEAAWLMSQQERNGYPFNKHKAEELEITLRARAAVLDAKLRKVVPPIPGKIFVPKRDNKKLGYKAGIPIQRYKDFNPNSRQQIEWIITNHFGYTPDVPELFDDEKGTRLKIDDETFGYLKTDPDAPEGVQKLAVVFEEYLMVSKRLGQLADGTQAWLKCIREDGCIHGSVNPNGAVTGRATHSHPNVAQVPAVGAPYGKECRELFTVNEGWTQVGVDASGLELRCLAHFMHPYDGGQYADTVINGDIHTINQHAAGLPTRNDAKRFIYAYLYGAGDELIGKLVGGGKKEGKKIKKEFLDKTPALARLKDAIQSTLVADEFRGQVTKWKRRYLKGLDGRLLHVRSLHSALNLLLQSAGALICKKWIVRWEQRLVDRGLTHGWEGDFCFMAWVHDEAQVAARTPEIAEIIKEEGQNAMKDTESFFNFRVALSTEGKIGDNWADCH